MLSHTGLPLASNTENNGAHLARQLAVLVERELVQIRIPELECPPPRRFGHGSHQLDTLLHKALGHRVDAALGEAEDDLR